VGRPEIRWGTTYLAVVLSDRADIPVMHAWSTGAWRPPFDRPAVACGRSRRYTDTGGPPFVLPVRHARLWCRPCQACQARVGPAP
jgi:hypothetical protein